MPSLLDDVIAQIQGLSDEDRAALTEEVVGATENLIWLPSPGPQTDAYFSEADELFYGGKPGGGKGFRLCQMVLTPFGWKAIGELKVGSSICATDGSVQQIIGYHRRGTQPLYKLSWSDGSETICDEDHIWLGWVTHRQKKIRNQITMGEGSADKWTTKQLFEHSKKFNVTKKRFAIPVMSAPCAFNVHGENKGPKKHISRSLSPYVLGVLLGDGSVCNSSATFFSADPEIAAKVSSLIPGYTLSRYEVPCDDRGHAQYRLPNASCIDHLKDIGVMGCRSDNKFIPRIYLLGSVEDRFELLRGLMDTDGWAETDGDCYYCSVSKQLAEDVRHLARSLGAIVSWRERIPTYTHHGEKLNGKRAYTIRIKINNPERMFSLQRKIDRCSGKVAQTMGIYLESIEPFGNDETVCISVSHRNSLFITEDFIVTHNSDLGVGLSLTQHKRTLFLRRQREEAKEIADRYFEVLGTRNGWNGQDLKLRTTDGRIIDIGGCNLEADKQKYKGIPHSLKFFDEIGDFSESQYRFIIIWNRSTNVGERCRVICAGNPPTTPEGLWVIKYWGPWLDPTHPNPAKPGELRWYLGTEDGDTEVDGPGPYPVPSNNGKVTMVRAKSRTFIPAELSDNPYLRDTNYESVLAGLTGDMRNAYFLGKFDATLKDDPKQVIPTSWIRLAQDRWTPQRPVGIPMCAMGVDPTGGGEDECVLAPRYDGWFPPMIVVPGKQLPFGKDIAGLVVANRRNHCVVIMDMGGGYGGSPYEILKDNDCEIVKYEGYKTSMRRTVDGKTKFKNDRAEAYWRFREALDPSQDGGSPIMLPSDPTLVADLTAPKFKITPNGIEITSKEDLVKKLKRSPNRGDAVVMSWWHGQKGLIQPSHASAEQGTMPRKTNGGMSVNFGRGSGSSPGVNFRRA